MATSAERIADASTREMMAALGPLGRVPLLRGAFERLFAVPSRRLGRALAAFDDDVARRGVALAASAALHRFQARIVVQGHVRVPTAGGVLVLANHPGAYDALALFAALGRSDACVVAHDRSFLRGLPHLAAHHLIFTSDADRDASSRASALRASIRGLRQAKALLHFGAGRIEPDAAFATDDPVAPVWFSGTGALVRAAARLGLVIVPAFVSGVHSPRAKALRVVRFAERHRVTTLAPLVQATVPGFRDVVVSVRFGAPLVVDVRESAIELTERARASVRTLGLRA